MGLPSPFTAGTGITAASLAAGAPLAGYKYADQPNSSPGNTTLVNDTDLVLSLAAGGLYAGFGMIVFSASTAANYKATLTAPAGFASGGWSPNLYAGTSGVVTNNAFLAYGATITANAQGTASNLSFTFQFSILMGAAAGSLQWQFAQASSDTSNLNTRAGSFIAAWKIQ